MASSVPESSDEEWRAFASMGGGYFKLPKDQLPNIEKALDFARSYENHFYKRPDEQRTYSIIKQESWSTELPADVYALAKAMKSIAAFALNKILKIANFEGDISLATGGLSDGNGLAEIKALYYDPGRKVIGTFQHKDERFFTVLLLEKPGLQGWYKEYNKYYEVLPLENHCFLNIGVFTLKL